MLRSDCGNSNVIRTTVKPYYAVTSKPSARTIWLCLSCTPFIPVAQYSRDNSGTSTSNHFQHMKAKWQQRPPGPALVLRRDALSCSQIAWHPPILWSQADGRISAPSHSPRCSGQPIQCTRTNPDCYQRIQFSSHHYLSSIAPHN